MSFVQRLKIWRQRKEESKLRQRLVAYADTFFNSLQTMYPELVEKPPGNTVLVFAPHADDETLGCGGTLVKHSRAGDAVRVVLWSDNRHSDPSYSNARELIRVRSAEFREAMTILGISDYCELGIDTALMTLPAEAEKTLQATIAEYRPEILYLPSFLDNHEEHRWLNKEVAWLCANTSLDITVWAYEVWTPLMPNRVVDITGAMDTKRRAIQTYKSQLKYIDYERAMLGLNQYRSMVSGSGKGWYEGFLVMPMKEYVGLVRKFLRV
jgi:LmbE family N-acetylglucosaminyl deacetylase